MNINATFLTLLICFMSFVSAYTNIYARSDENMPASKTTIPSFVRLFVAHNMPYADIKDELLLALEDRGMVLSYHAHVAEMLHRTATDVGHTDRVYQHADIFGFCKADLSNATVREDPHSLALCPFAITVYQLVGDQRIYVSYRAFPNLPKDSAWHAVEILLQDLIAETGATPYQK